jgi:hypothetical protein
MQPTSEAKYYPFPHSWSKPQLILKFMETNPEDAFTPFYQWNQRAMHHAVFTHYVTGKYVLDFMKGTGFVPLIPSNWNFYGIIATASPQARS